jgi:hypothetical protein
MSGMNQIFLTFFMDLEVLSGKLRKQVPAGADQNG